MSWDRFDEYSWEVRRRLEGIDAKLGGLRPTPEEERSAAMQQLYRDAQAGVNRIALMQQDARRERFENFSYAIRNEIIEIENGGWTPWLNVELGPAGRLTYGYLPDGNVELFSVKKNGEVVHSWIEGGGKRTPWHSLGGQVSQDICVGRDEDKRLEVFVRGTDNKMYLKHKKNEWGDWSDWIDMGGNIRSAPKVESFGDGNLGVFAVGQDGAMWHKWQHEPNGWSGWSDWHSLGGNISDRFVIGKNQDRRLELFAIGTNGQVYSNWHEHSDRLFGWSGWHGVHNSKLDKKEEFSSLAVSNTGAGQLELFGSTYKHDNYHGITTQRVFHKWQHEANGGSGWSDWHMMPQAYIDRELAAVQNRYGNNEVFVTNQYGYMQHRYFDGNQWSKWILHPDNDIGNLTVLKFHDRIVVLAQTSNGYVYKHQN